MTSPDPREKESEQYIEQGKDNVLLNIDPTSPPPMKTLVYSPEIKILIARGNKQYDVSADVVAWSLRRPENSIASLVFRLSNKPASNTDLKKLRYKQLFERMDRVTVFLKRIEWVQVFSGYLDSVPHVQIYPGTVNFRASCTLKRLLHTWWDPGLPESQHIFDQSGRALAELENGEMQTDMGLGSLLRRLLVLVGGWNPQNIHIQRFPSGFYDYMEKQIRRLTPGAEKDVRSFKELLLGEGDISMGPGRAAGRQQGITMGGYMVSQPERMLEVIRAVDEMGMGPDNMDLAASQGLGTVAEGVKDYQDQEFSKGQTEVGKNWYDAALKSDAAIHCFMTIAAESNWIMYANRAAPESLGYPYDPGAISTDGSSVGLYQQQNNGAWGCLPAWSPVFTAHGPVPIIDVQEGDEVWSFNGDRMELAKVTGWQMTGYKRLLTIRTEGRALEVTANHRIPVRRYFGLSDGRRQGECGWETIEMCAGEIRPGDYVIVPHGLPSGDATTAPDGTLLTTELMELIGLYLGDGNRDGTGRIEISHGHGINEDHMPHYREIIESLGAEPRVDKRGTRTRFSLPWFRQFIDSWFPGKAGSKKLPDWVFRLSPDLQLGLLRGYLDSDGSVDKLGRVIWSTVSPELAEGVRHLCIQLGIPVGAIGVNRPRTGTIRGRVHRGSISYTVRASSTRHNLRIGSHSPHKAINFRINDIPAKSRYDQDWNSSICRRTPMGKPPTGTVYHRVRSVTQGESEVPVYDIEVGGLHHYVADGIVVHNSTAQRMNVKASTQMFLEQLNRYEWRNMDRAAACQAVQRSAFADGSNYKKWEQAAIEQVRAIRSGTGTATGAAGAASGNPIPGTNLGGTPVGTNIAPALPGTSNITGVPGVPTVNGMPGPTAVASVVGKPLYDSGGALSCALAQVGRPYVRGANGPDAFDCSSLMQFSYRSIGLEISRTTYTQASQLERIPATNLRPGDMIQPDEGHVVMYVSPGWVVHAPQPGDVVQVAPMWFDPNTAVCLRAPGAEFGGTVPTAFDITKAMSATNAVAGTVTTGLNGSTGTGQTEQVARNLFAYQFAGGQFASAISIMFGGEVGTQEKAFINDEPLIQTVVSFAQAGLRNFQSAPNGDFIAYYPDYFGLDGKDAVFALEDIEMKNVQIDLNDDAMATHVYISGSTQMNGSGGGGVMGWLNSKGVATVENQWLFARMAAAAPHVPGEFIPNGKDVMRKFGARPLQKSMSSVQSGPMEFLLAVQTFMTKWAEQYATTIETTFLPEVFPGMRLHLVDHGLQVYVAEVTHSGDYESGFTTSMVITAPSNPALRNMATNIFNSTAKDIAERQDLTSNKSEVAN